MAIWDDASAADCFVSGPADDLNCQPGNRPFSQLPRTTRLRHESEREGKGSVRGWKETGYIMQPSLFNFFCNERQQRDKNRKPRDERITGSHDGLKKEVWIKVTEAGRRRRWEGREVKRGGERKVREDRRTRGRIKRDFWSLIPAQTTAVSWPFPAVLILKQDWQYGLYSNNQNLGFYFHSFLFLHLFLLFLHSHLCTSLTSTVQPLMLMYSIHFRFLFSLLSC